MPTGQNAFISTPVDTIFVSIEMSRSKWLVGTHSPLSDKISLHATNWGDTGTLFAIIERLRRRAAETLGADLPVLCCYEAGYEGF